jgi:hypothetical protein
MSSTPPVERLMVSGTRVGMTAAQKDAFADVLHKHAAVRQLLHGDCIGADAQCHRLAREKVGRDLAVHIYPPKDERQRAWCQVGDVGELVVHDADTYLKRDFKMVKAADLVVAFPSGRKEQRRGSGTWAVIREARRKRVPLVVVYPDGGKGE